ncbi:helix-turn-helix domain-containing protein [Kutzneria viridogrisea]|uniref:HTH cro/C1-type domain-containing protein n=3 Tax=Kutzneria TaxID=43356 RepID=W5WN35_9PSEU|nr:helix-turn-helix transcriptional regulator [Kutzneria albida]AHI02166.1 hypothetical protein KALB_8809 [Kutzneria albida DSM 43870]
MREDHAFEWAGELGRNVRRMRIERGWTQAELAAAADMTQPAIARFERANAIPTLRVLERIAQALGVELVVSLRQPQNRPDTRIAVAAARDQPWG